MLEGLRDAVQRFEQPVDDPLAAVAAQLEDTQAPEEADAAQLEDTPAPEEAADTAPEAEAGARRQAVAVSYRWAYIVD